MFITNPVPRVLICGILTGILLGLLQWQIFRKYRYHVSWLWMVSTVLICGTFPSLRQILYPAPDYTPMCLMLLLGGLILAFAQWRLLQPAARRPGGWVFVYGLADAGLFLLINPQPDAGFITLLAGSVYGGVSGFALSKFVASSLSSGKEIPAG